MSATTATTTIGPMISARTRFGVGEGGRHFGMLTVVRGGFVPITSSPRDVHRVVGAPEHDREKEVDDHDRDDGGSDSPAAGHTDTGRSSAGVVAVIAVHERTH